MRAILTLLAFLGLLSLCAAEVAAQESIAAWQQGFEENTDGWITDETPEAEGWCGDIERFESGGGPVEPSVGNAYAVVTHGACNDYWTENGFPEGSGPYAPFGEYSESWPSDGFTTELDIYLDPGWEAGTSFTYAISVRLLDVTPLPDSFRYLTLPVTKEEGELLVGGNVVSEAGWYTFRHRFMDDGGQLAGEFQLVRGDETLFTQELTTTGFSEEEISSYETSNVGTGYVWFVSLSEGLNLPIDEARFTPGQAQEQEAQTEEESTMLPESGGGSVLSGPWSLLAIAGFLMLLSGSLVAAWRRPRRDD
jgi:hypothetical protein